MHRRNLLRHAALGGALAALGTARTAWPAVRQAGFARPGGVGWPAPEAWAELGRNTDGALIAVRSPLADCIATPGQPGRDALLEALRNPFYISDEPGLTQTLGWVGAWTSQPSPYAIAARNTADVAAAVNFAREHRLRLAVKGGGHSYQGNSNAADSLLIWTHRMRAVTVHDAFVARGCEGRDAAVPAVSVEAGALWLDVYDAVTTKAGRYVQGGGCTTVGVAGLIQGGGFGSHSKRFGLAAAGLLEAEVVTADGQVRIANPCDNPDLFWGLKGGGGGSLGVVTRLTLATHELPATFGAVNLTVQARSDAAYRALIARILDFYRVALFNPHWGEQISFTTDNIVRAHMMFQGLGQAEAEAVWRPFLGWLTANPQDYALVGEPFIQAFPARIMWDGAVLKGVPGVIVPDARPGARAGDFLWSGDRDQAGQYLHAYQSLWLGQDLLGPDRRDALATAMFDATRWWDFALHFNKGLAGAPPEAVARARNTAINPAALDAFALAICGAGQGPAYPGLAGREPDVAAGARHAAAVTAAMDALRGVSPGGGAYLAESDYFQRDWRSAFWGSNYPRLLEVKRRYDPDGLFSVHHGVGSA